MKRHLELRNSFERLEEKLVVTIEKSLKKNSEGRYALNSLVDLYRKEIDRLASDLREYLGDEEDIEVTITQ